MTSYKKAAQEAEEKLHESLHQIEVLKQQLDLSRNGLVDELMLHMDSEEAKQVLRIFSERAQDRDELVMLIRALSKL